MFRAEICLKLSTDLKPQGKIKSGINQTEQWCLHLHIGLRVTRESKGNQLRETGPPADMFMVKPEMLLRTFNSATIWLTIKVRLGIPIGFCVVLLMVLLFVG